MTETKAEIFIIGIENLPEKKGFRRIAHKTTSSLNQWYCGYFHGWHLTTKSTGQVTVAIIESSNKSIFSYEIVQNQFQFIDE